MNNPISNRTRKAMAGLALFSLHLLVPMKVTTSMASSINSNKSILELAACMIPLSEDLSSSGDKMATSKSKSANGINTAVKSAVKASLISDADMKTYYFAADSIYSMLELKKRGLSQTAFRYAWKGYQKLRVKGQVRRSDVLSICDFSQSSRRKRLYVIDLEEGKLLMQTYVAHGKNSGSEYAKRFSNKPESHQSSLGFYVTRSTYYGEHGLALKIDGLERGINDRAFARNIVVHGSDYVGTQFLRDHKKIGRSFGCPAVPREQAGKIINTIKQGSCLFIYHPTQNYVRSSKILNT